MRSLCYRAYVHMKPTKVPVTERALVQRINRALREEDSIVKRSRSQFSFGNNLISPGDYFRLSLSRNFLEAGPVDLAELGQKLGVLKPWETLQ